MDVGGERRYVCEYCNFPFKDIYMLKRHINVKHTQEESHVCDICSGIFYTKYKLSIHMASKHGINAEFQCTKCKRYLMSEFSLKKHVRKCEFTPCPVCGKEFKNRWKLKNHMKGHVQEKPHVCDECGKDFMHRTSLTEHIEIVHQGKTPFQCETCSKKFSRSGTLRQHKLIHTGIKPFSCHFCERKFREKVQLINHLKKKHNVDNDQIPFYVKIIPKKVLLEDTTATVEELLPSVPKIKKEPVFFQMNNPNTLKTEFKKNVSQHLNQENDIKEEEFQPILKPISESEHNLNEKKPDIENTRMEESYQRVIKSISESEHNVNEKKPLLENAQTVESDLSSLDSLVEKLSQNTNSGHSDSGDIITRKAKPEDKVNLWCTSDDLEDFQFENIVL